MNFKKLAQGKTYGVSEKAPKFLYDALKEGEDFAFMKRDYKSWQVVMPLDVYKELIGEKKYKVCPCCGSKVYED